MESRQPQYLSRIELIASNSMIPHELYFDSLGGESQPDGDLRGALERDFGSAEKWQRSLRRWARHSRELYFL
jgi:superoxide dismutase